MRLVDSVMRGYPIPLIYLHHIRKEVAGAQRDDFEIHLMLLVDRLLDHDQQELAVNLSSALETFRLNVTQDRKAQRGDFWVEYGQLTQTGSHAKDTIERRHKFFAEKMMALLNPQPEDLQTQL